VNAQEHAQKLKTIARDIGFEMAGICRPGPIEHADYLERWLADGRAGSMAYMHNHPASRRDPTSWLPWARSALVVGFNYFQQPPTEAVEREDDERYGQVAQYAWGEDYHRVLRDKLTDVMARFVATVDGEVQHRICVDTAAVIEREIALSAGIGWIGKNTLVLHPHWGSFFFLGVVFLDLELPADEPMTDHCGSCTRCLDACPTDAFPAPYEMDASRCISYLTIEHRDAIEPPLDQQLNGWVFGCDDCQTVCPFNHWQRATNETRFAPKNVDNIAPALDQLLDLTDAELRTMHKGRATSRAKPEMWRRNARLVQESKRD